MGCTRTLFFYYLARAVCVNFWCVCVCVYCICLLLLLFVCVCVYNIMIFDEKKTFF